jgi:hypothetical protein
MTDPAPDPATAGPANVPPDPEAYDSARAVEARRKGLPGPYIPGGGDPDLEATRRQERRYLWLLIGMVVVIVASGYVLGFLASVLGG